MDSKGFTIFEIVVSLFIVSILAVVALPYYQKFLLKARVADGLGLASGAKIAVAEYVYSKGALPQSQEDTAYQSPASTDSVEKITIGQNGVIEISYTPQASYGTIILTPSMDANNTLTWSCDAGTLPNQYRPTNCKGTKVAAGDTTTNDNTTTVHDGNANDTNSGASTDEIVDKKAQRKAEREARKAAKEAKNKSNK